MAALFEHPEWVMAAIAWVVLLAVAVATAQAWAKRRARRLLGPGARLSAVRRDVLLLGAVAFIAVALLGPRIGERMVLVSTRGADVVFLLDVSRSMDARDVAPSRMQRAQSAADELLARLEPGDRAALAAFSSRGVLLTPLTPDAAALREMLTALDTKLIRPPSSDLDGGVEAALSAFDDASDRPRVLVVLSDGEFASRDTDDAAAQAQRHDVRVLVVPLGTEAGATIPSTGGELRDATGRVVVTRRRTEPLANLAERTDGVVLRTNEWGEIDGRAAANEIAREARGVAGQFVERRVKAPLVLPFALAAFVLLFIEGLPAALARRAFDGLRQATLRFGLGRAATAAMVGALIVAPQPGPAAAEVEVDPVLIELESRARVRPLSAHELIALGLARARADRWDEADNSFLAAALQARGDQLAAVAYHNLGVIALRNDELERAREFFFDSLSLRPGNGETRFNLEWTLAALDVKDPEPEPLFDPLSEGGPTEPDDEAEPPEPEEDDTPTPQPRLPEPATEREEATEEAKPEPLSDAQRERWLEKIADDPTRALGSAAKPRDDAPPPRVRDAPAW